MLGIPSVIIVCENKDNTLGVETKMTSLGAAIQAAAELNRPGVRPPEVAVMKAMDGVQKNWTAQKYDDFVAANKTFVVPGTYLPAVRCLSEYIEKSGVRPMVLIDEGDKLAKYFFLMDTPDARLPPLELSLKKIYNAARGACFVTATPSSFLEFGRANKLKFRAFLVDLDRLKDNGYETGDHISFHPSCAGLTDKDFDKLSGFFIPQIQDGVREMYALSRADAQGLLGLFVLNHVHNPCDQFSNCDMARIVVHGLQKEITRGKYDIDPCAPLCRNAFALVVSGEKAYVACAELASMPNEAGPGWEGFKAFGRHNGKNAKTRASEWIHSWPDALKRPMFCFGYESMIRSFSPRFETRVLTSLFAHLKKSKNTDCASQLGHRANGSGVPEQLFQNGLFASQTYSTKADYDVFSAYHPYMREILQYALDDYVSMEHVFEGGVPGRELSKPCRPMKFAKRSHFPKNVARNGNPIGNIRVSNVGPDKTPDQLAIEELQRKNQEIVRKASTALFHSQVRARLAAAEHAAEVQEFVEDARETTNVPTAVSAHFKHLVLCRDQSLQVFRAMEHSLALDDAVSVSAKNCLKSAVSNAFPDVSFQSVVFVRDEARFATAKARMDAGLDLATTHAVEIIVDVRGGAQDPECELFVLLKRRLANAVLPKNRLMILLHELVGGDVDKVVSLADMRALPELAALAGAQNRNVLRRLVVEGLVEQPEGARKQGQYKITAAGVDYVCRI
jgi:hypothetical protein